MKYVLRLFLFHSFSLWLASQMLPGLALAQSWQMVLFAGFVLSLLMLVIAPILRILFIPINILTFGLFSWLINGIVLYLLTVFVPEVSVTGWQFNGGSFLGIAIPAMHITYVASLIICSMVVTFFVNFLRDITE